MSTREAARAQSSEGARSRGYPSGRGSIAWQASKQPTSASTSCRSGGKRPASHAPTPLSPAASLASVAPAAGAGGGGGGRAPSSWRSLTLVAYLGKQNKGTKGCRQGLSGARAAPLLLASSHTGASRNRGVARDSGDSGNRDVSSQHARPHLPHSAELGASAHIAWPPTALSVPLSVCIGQ